MFYEIIMVEHFFGPYNTCITLNLLSQLFFFFITDVLDVWHIILIGIGVIAVVVAIVINFHEACHILSEYMFSIVQLLFIPQKLL